jgi:uncharacterized alkaline shock family protein YloU
MRFLTRLALLFYVTIITVTGLCFLAFIAHVIELDLVLDMVTVVYNDANVGLITAAVVAIIILKSFMFARLIYGRQRKERTIAFENPSGEVSVSLSAMEDLLRRMITQIPEVREIRPNIIATKKGLDVEIRLVLRSEVNIPEMTLRLQNMVRDKIQDAIGIEEKVNIHVHVIKIVSDENKPRKKEKGLKTEEPEEPNVPFQGYRA